MTMFNVIGVTVAMLASTAHGKIVNQVSSDLMVLRAEVIGILDNSSSSSVQTKNCDNRKKLGYHEWYDCTALISNKFSSPAFHAIYIKQGSAISCKIVRVKTLTKNIALKSSKGIGFAHGRKSRGQNVKFITLGSLKKVKSLSLGKGVVGTVHEFVGLSECKIGGSIASYQFRPFLSFSTPGGSNYRSWDKFGYYQIPADRNGFDQTSRISEMSQGAATPGNTSTNGKSIIFLGADPEVKKNSKAGILFEETDESYLLPD